MKLSEITEKTPLVKDFTQRLAKSVGEAIVSTVIGKAKRTSGVSAVPVDINLENGQVVTIYIRLASNTNIKSTEKVEDNAVSVNGINLATDTAGVRKGFKQGNLATLNNIKADFDIYRVDINGKQMPTTGDFDNSYKPAFNKSVDEVANFVKNGQVAFDKKQSAQKVKAPPHKNPNIPMGKQIQELQTKAKELDQQISQKTEQKQALQDQLTALQANKIA